MWCGKILLVWPWLRRKFCLRIRYNCFNWKFLAPNWNIEFILKAREGFFSPSNSKFKILFPPYLKSAISHESPPNLYKWPIVSPNCNEESHILELVCGQQTLVHILRKAWFVWFMCTFILRNNRNLWVMASSFYLRWRVSLVLHCSSCRLAKELIRNGLFDFWSWTLTLISRQI